MRVGDLAIASREERGTVTAFVTVMTLAMLMAAGLVLDGGNLLAARREAMDVAGQAARAGAQAVDLDALRRRSTDLDASAAVAEARSFLASRGYSGSVVVAGDRVRVTVEARRDLGLLRLVGLTSAAVSGTGHARLVRGVREGET